jgi:hypothetical protein
MDGSKGLPAPLTDDCHKGDAAHNAHRHVHCRIFHFLCQGGHTVKPNEGEKHKRSAIEYTLDPAATTS